MREYLAALGAIAMGGVLLLVGYGATWAVAVVSVFAGGGPSDPVTEVTLTGRDLAPVGGAVGWVALAGVAGVLATRTWGRRVVGGVLALSGGVAGVTALTYGLTGAAFVQDTLAARSVGPVAGVTTTVWWVVALVGGMAVGISGLVTALRGPGWPRLSGRYERTRGAMPRDLPRDLPPGEATVGGIAAWDALDRGEDPTDPGARAG